MIGRGCRGRGFGSGQMRLGRNYGHKGNGEFGDFGGYWVLRGFFFENSNVPSLSAKPASFSDFIG